MQWGGFERKAGEPLPVMGAIDFQGALCVRSLRELKVNFRWPLGRLGWMAGLLQDTRVVDILQLCGPGQVALTF